MHGNVLEWCKDGVLRGGGFSYTDEFMQSHYSLEVPVDSKAQYLGFRVVLVQADN